MAHCILQEVLSPNKCGNPCAIEMHAGEMLGMLSALQYLPVLVHVLKPDSQHKVNVPKLLQILKPNVSQKHLGLCHILEFATGASEEPVLQFSMVPATEFVLPLTPNIEDSKSNP